MQMARLERELEYAQGLSVFPRWAGKDKVVILPSRSRPILAPDCNEKRSVRMDLEEYFEPEYDLEYDDDI